MILHTMHVRDGKSVRATAAVFSQSILTGRNFSARAIRAALALLLAATALSSPALANGGNGGAKGRHGAGEIGGIGGGDGADGTTPSNGGALGNGGGGGGGGGAGGGNGADGDVGDTPAGAGGAGGTVGAPDGVVGSSAASGSGSNTGGGGGGGGGGYNGNGAGGAIGTNTLVLQGGAGGNGGNGGGATGVAAGGGGGGGAGGYGAIATGGGAVTNTGSMIGGAGGAGGDGGNAATPGAAFGGSGGSGGDGGIGLSMSAGMTLDNQGTVEGGTGGAAGAAGSGGSVGDAGQNGAGGAGVVGAGLTVINSGTITGGMGGDGVTRANAITFSGGANTLTLQNGSAITGNIAIDGSGGLTFNQSTAQTLSNVITGNGSVIQNGIGTLTLTGANTFSGGTTITSGTISAGSSSALGTGAVTLNGGSLQRGGISPLTLTNAFRINTTGGSIDAAAGQLILTGAITDGNGAGGALTILSSGGGSGVTFASSGMNTYSGATIIGDGTAGGAVALLGSQSNAFSANSAVTVTAHSFLDVGDVSQTIGSLAGAGRVNASGIGGVGTLITGGDNSSTTFSGVLSNGGATLALIKAGTGTMTLTGVNTYSGATTVSAGTLRVDGSIAASTSTVNAGGTLGGNGTVGGTTVNGGVLAPGNSIGTLTVQGNLVFTAAASYMVEVSPTNADRVSVTGSATLGGATVNASFASGSYVSKQYTIVNATGGVIGTFGTQANTNLPANFTSNLSYDANNAYLNLTLNFTPDVPVAPGQSAPVYAPLNANQQKVANTLVSYFNTTGGIPMVFGALTSSGLTQVSGETVTGSQQVTFDAMNQFMGIMTDPFAAGRGTSTPNAMGYADDDALAYASDGRRRSRPEREAFAMFAKAPPKAFEARWNVWAAGFGGSRATDGNAALGANNTTSSIYGTAVGADYWFSPATVAGFSMAGGGTNFSVANGGSGHSDLVQAGAFVRHSEGSAYITAAAAYGWQNVTTDRLVVAGVTDRLQAAFNANAYSARVEGGNRWSMPALGGIGVTPYAAVQVTALDLPAYAETSTNGVSTFALNYAGKTVTDTRTELGFRTDKAFALDNAVLTLRGRAAWSHDFSTDRSIAATFQSLPAGGGFTVNGAPASRDAALTSVSAETSFANGMSLAAAFDGEFSNTTRSYAGKGVVRYAW